MKEFQQMQNYMASMSKDMQGKDPNAAPSAAAPFAGLGGMGGASAGGGGGGGGVVLNR